MAALFAPITLRSVTLSNRIAVPPMSQFCAEDGKPTAWHVQHYCSLAASSPGLIVIESTSVSSEGRCTPHCLCLYTDAHESALCELVREMKSCGSSKVAIQLAHAGRKAAEEWVDGREQPLSEGGWEAVAPSAIPNSPVWPTPTELTESGMKSILSSFVSSAERANRAHIDALELQCAHGYLLHQFLSPISNTRTDEYGGELGNRMRFPLEVISGVRGVWPGEKPLGVRISATEWSSRRQFDLSEAILFVTECRQRGVDYVCVSSYGNDADAVIPEAPGFQLQLAKTIKAATGVVTRAVGCIASALDAEKALRDDCADIVAVGRAHINDVRWTWHAAVQLGAQANWPLAYRRARPDVWPGYALFSS